MKKNISGIAGSNCKNTSIRIIVLVMFVLSGICCNNNDTTKLTGVYERIPSDHMYSVWKEGYTGSEKFENSLRYKVFMEELTKNRIVFSADGTYSLEGMQAHTGKYQVSSNKLILTPNKNNGVVLKDKYEFQMESQGTILKRIQANDVIIYKKR